MASPRRMLFWIPSDPRNVAPPDPVPTPLDPRVNLGSAHTSCRTHIARLRARIDAIGRESAPSHWSGQKPPSLFYKEARGIIPLIPREARARNGVVASEPHAREAQQRDHGAGSDRSGERSGGCPTTELTQGERPARCSPRPRRGRPPDPASGNTAFCGSRGSRDMLCRRLGSRATRGRGEARRHRPSGGHW